MLQIKSKFAAAAIATASLLAVVSNANQAQAGCLPTPSSPTKLQLQDGDEVGGEGRSYRKQVVQYKPCGTPYYVWTTAYRTVKVPVTYEVKVWH
ncbi:MAG: hypothetical protein R3C05_16395 [Pirellulaceae bacterium]